MFHPLSSLLLLLLPLSAVEPHRDIVVYGGTSGGVTAAVQAARSGRSVVLISPTTHLGGLTTSGLGWTDLGDPSILGGLSREFYEAVYTHYQDDGAWNWEAKNTGMAGQSGPAFNASLGIASVFEPKVAEAIFNGMIADANVTVVNGKLDLENGVQRTGTTIDSITLEDGRVFPGSMFIDASYEGDLLPGAGVSFTIGRESNATYGEGYNGIQTARATKNQLPSGIDPYVVQGNPASGLIAGVDADPPGTDGDADHRLQAYCFRMVLTNVAANRIAIPQPAGYDEADYELLFRAIEAGQTSGFYKYSMMPNRKTDSNNTGGISTDFIGMNYGSDWNWATLDHAEREALALEHENWQRGLVWTLQNHPRVPSNIRNAHAGWGLPADEFTDNGNWPWQIYVREARRMVSDFVMSERNCLGVEVVADSVGLAAYTMDSHNVRRQVVGGMVLNEGDVQKGVPSPYPVAYRALVPKRAECSNLLVPWSLSASHIAFGSIRMEPVFMTLGQSAAIAADLALDDNVAVQDVPYPQLRTALLAAGQALGDPASASPEVVIDNADPSVVVTGGWIAGTSTTGYVGIDYLHDNNEGQGTKSVFYPFEISGAGLRRVQLRWTSHANRATNVPVTVSHAGQETVFHVNQQQDGGKWVDLAILTFDGSEGEGLTVSNSSTNGFVIADAAGYSEVDGDEDSDGDGMSNLRESLLGTDPLVSNAELFSGIPNHPDYFGLYADSEVADFFLVGPGISDTNHIFFDLTDKTSLIESFAAPFEPQGASRFFRLALTGEPAGFVSRLAAGDELTIVTYGTSLTANGAWVSDLRTWLSTAYPDQVTVVNSGLSGENSATGVSQLQTRVLQHSPDVVFIEFAMNDAFRYTDRIPLSVEDARQNLDTMVTSILIQNPACEIILQTMNTVWDSPAGSNQSATLRPELAAYYEMYRTFARDNELLLIDHEPAWSSLQETDPAAFQAAIPDGVHPAAAALATHMIPYLHWKLGGGGPLP